MSTIALLNHFCLNEQMSQAQSSNSNIPDTDFNLLEDSEDADNHTSDATATRLSLQFHWMKVILGNVSTRLRPWSGAIFSRKAQAMDQRRQFISEWSTS